MRDGGERECGGWRGRGRKGCLNIEEEGVMKGLRLLGYVYLFEKYMMVRIGERGWGI